MTHNKWLSLIPALLLSATLAFAASVVPSEEEQKAIQQNLNEAFNSYVSQDFERALMHFQKVLQIDPYDAAALKGVKLCRKNLQRSAVDRMKEEEQKLKLSKKLVREEKWLDAIDNLRDIANHQYLQTDALKLLGEVEVIIRRKISQSVVGSGDYLAYQGILYYMNRRYGEALKVWREAEQISAENFKVTVYIQRVEQFYQETAQTESGAYRKRAVAAFEAGNYDESLQHWRKVLEYEPKDEQAQLEISKLDGLINKKNNQSVIGEYYDRGWSLFQEEKYAESLAEWKKIVEIDPNNEVALDYIAKIGKMGVAAPAAAAPISAPATAASAVSVPAAAVPVPVPPVPPVPVAAPAPPPVKTPVPAAVAALNYDPGVEYFNAGNHLKAVEFFDQLYRSHSDDAKAKEWLDKSLKAQNEKADKHYQQGLMAYSLGNVEDAIKEWRSALDVYPNHPSAKRALLKVGASR